MKTCSQRMDGGSVGSPRGTRIRRSAIFPLKKFDYGHVCGTYDKK